MQQLSSLVHCDVANRFINVSVSRLGEATLMESAERNKLALMPIPLNYYDISLNY